MILAMAPTSAETPVDRTYLNDAIKRIATGARVWWLPVNKTWVVMKPGQPPVTCRTAEAARAAYLRAAR
jgi:hypothetical protein